MARGSFAQRRSPNDRNGGFSDAELERIRLHEAAQDRANRVLGSEAIDIGSLVFVYAKRNVVASWQSLLESALAIEKFNRLHAAHHTAFHAFPFTSADVARVIRWRQANPRG